MSEVIQDGKLGGVQLVSQLRAALAWFLGTAQNGTQDVFVWQTVREGRPAVVICHPPDYLRPIRLSVVADTAEGTRETLNAVLRPSDAARLREALSCLV